MQTLESPQAVFFDLFDTLIRIDLGRLRPLDWKGRRIFSTVPEVHERHLAPRGVALEAFVPALQEAHRQVSERKRDSWIEVPAIERWALVVAQMEFAEGPEAEALARELTETHARTLAAAAVPVEGARQVLERVHERGLATALISNFDHTPAADWILEGTGLADLLDKRVVSETLGVRKPDPRMFVEALEHFGVAPENSVHVGDQAAADAWGAGRLGLRTVWINAGNAAYSEEGHPPTLVLSRLVELLEHL